MGGMGRIGIMLSRNDALGRALPPHPTPLPWGEGGPSTDSDRRNRLVYGTAGGVKAKAGSPLRSAPALHKVELNRSR
jgi:hypothetical protein